MSEKWTFYSETGDVYQVDHQPGRNDPCPCRSGKKYKRCCGEDGAYSWPIVTAISPDAGSIIIHVHCLRKPATGETLFMAIVPEGPNERLSRRKMVRLVHDVAAGVGDEVVRITDSDIPDHAAGKLGRLFLENEGMGRVALIPAADLMNDRPLKLDN
jgi:hypothetical protein